MCFLFVCLFVQLIGYRSRDRELKGEFWFECMDGLSIHTNSYLFDALVISVCALRCEILTTLE